MSAADRNYHETWLGMVQPIDGLVFSVPVLVDAQALERRPASFQTELHTHLDGLDDDGAPVRIRDLPAFFEALLGLTPDLFDENGALPEDLGVYVEEGKQTLRPTRALKKIEPGDLPEDADLTPAAKAGHAYAAFVWDLPAGLPLDKPENQTGDWNYPPLWKMDRLLRACRVPIGLLTNREVIALVYAPHGESTGVLTFRLADMATEGGRPILDAFATLLSAQRFFGVAEDKTLTAILQESRKRQANVTEELAQQVFEALELLLAGFAEAERRDDTGALRAALEAEPDGDHVYGGLLTVLLRLVFLLYAEERNLLPTDAALFREHLSLIGLYEQLQADHDTYLESMSRRFGAWPRLLALFRAVFDGVEAPGLELPARRGVLFDPAQYPFLEGNLPGAAAPIGRPEEQSEMRVPSIDDLTIYGALSRLLFLDGQRLSYRALDVEQIGSVYEALMGFHVVRATSRGLPIRSKNARIWIFAEDVLGEKPARRGAWLQDAANLSKSQVKKPLRDALSKATTEDEVLEALLPLAPRKAVGCTPGRLVLQPGRERRRTSSHYTPPSLTQPIVRRTLEPLIAAMGGEPTAEQLLSLKVCDPAMGSGAFLVAACRYLGDQVVAAWTRAGQLEHIASEHDPVMAARRLVAQRCLYGVDKNPFAVNLAKLSLWLETLAMDQPFTFVDHALRHGDSLVGLSLEQIRAFHWAPDDQLDWCAETLSEELDEALADRQRIVELAGQDSAAATKEKELALRDADDAISRAKLLADLVIGAFFAESKDKARKAERNRRLELAQAWIEDGGEPPVELLEMQAELRERLPTFHWELEFPEVFYDARPDPLEAGMVNEAAMMDAFVGNPPFASKNGIVDIGGARYVPWLLETHDGAHGNADLSAFFFRRSFQLLGVSGCLGLVATKTIAQGDTRVSGLKHLVNHGGRIYSAERSFSWPGSANVNVSIVHVSTGATNPRCSLDGQVVPEVNSRLRPHPERPDPVAIDSNRCLRFMGPKVYGSGFFVGQDEVDAICTANPSHRGFFMPFIGGAEINSDPLRRPQRVVLNLGQMSLADAERLPQLVNLIRQRVKPERDRANEATADGAHRKKYWWQFAQPRPDLFAALSGLDQCIALSRVTKHLVFSFFPSDIVFSDGCYVFASQDPSLLGVLQSRVHERWTLLLSSSMRSDIRYVASDCFDTFPLPRPGKQEASLALCAAAEKLVARRDDYMVGAEAGLTETYNRLRKPTGSDPEILDLRELHEAMDRAVLDAYGWSDIEVPPYCPSTPAERKAFEAFEDEVLDRLFALNAERAEEERKAGLTGKKAAKKKTRRKKAALKDQPALIPVPDEEAS